MDVTKQIVKQKQVIAQQEKQLALEKLKKRRADTRRKIELGGLVIKSGMDAFNKAVILGALFEALKSIEQDEDCLKIFELKGDVLFTTMMKDN